MRSEPVALRMCDISAGADGGCRAGVRPWRPLVSARCSRLRRAAGSRAVPWRSSVRPATLAGRRPELLGGTEVAGHAALMVSWLPSTLTVASRRSNPDTAKASDPAVRVTAPRPNSTSEPM